MDLIFSSVRGQGNIFQQQGLSMLLEDCHYPPSIWVLKGTMVGSSFSGTFPTLPLPFSLKSTELEIPESVPMWCDL